MPILETIAVVAKEGTKKSIEGIKNIAEIKIQEDIKNQIENVKKTTGNAVMDKIESIKNWTPEQLRQELDNNLSKNNFENTVEINDNKETKELIDDVKKTRIKEETGWSDEIIDSINSMKEYDIYKNVGLEENQIGEKKALIRDDIDWKQADAMGRTNKERAEQGLAPINKNNKVVELHHVGQHADSPLAELTTQEHRGKGNDTILHNKAKESEIDRVVFAKEKNEYWKQRAS